METKVADIEVRKEQMIAQEKEYWRFVGGMVVLIALVVGAVLWIASVVAWWGALLILVGAVIFSFYTDIIGKRAGDTIKAIEDEAGFAVLKQQETKRGRLRKVILWVVFVGVFSYGLYLYSHYQNEVTALTFLVVYYGAYILIIRFLWRSLIK